MVVSGEWSVGCEHWDMVSEMDVVSGMWSLRVWLVGWLWSVGRVWSVGSGQWGVVN